MRISSISPVPERGTAPSIANEVFEAFFFTWEAVDSVELSNERVHYAENSDINICSGQDSNVMDEQCQM